MKHFDYKDLSEMFCEEVKLNNGKSFYLKLVKSLGKTDILVYSDKKDENGVLCEAVFQGKTEAVRTFLTEQGQNDTETKDKPVVKVGFCRVSTVEQDLTLQVKAVKSYGVTDANLFQSKHSGKAETNKQAIESLLERVKLLSDSGMSVQVVVSKLDRLGRSMSQVLNTVEELRGLGASLVAIEQNIDTSKSGIETTMLLGMFSMFAEMERQFIYERTQGARKAIGKAANGGRPTVQSEEMIKEANTLKSAGVPMTTIAKTLGIGRATLYRMLEK